MEVDMLILWLIVVVFLLLILTIIIFLWYSGFFVRPDIKTCKPPFKTLEIAYKFAKGPYKESSLLFAEAHSLAPKLRCIGVYYDDPNEFQVEGKLRYLIGLILNDEQKVDEEMLRNIQLKGFQFASFPEVDHVVHTSFAHKSFVSVLIAVYKLIPLFRDYIKERELQAYPFIEIYDGVDIVYAAPLSKQGDFFVPEALVESEEEPTSDQRTAEETEEASLEDLQPDTASSMDSLAEGQSNDLPSLEIIDSLEENNKNGMTNGSEASTESFEELQLDS